MPSWVLPGDPSGPPSGLTADRGPVGPRPDHPSQLAQPWVGQPPVGQSQFGQAPVGQSQFGQPPVGPPQFGQAPVGQPPVGQPQFGQPQFGQAPVDQPLGAQPSAGQRPAWQQGPGWATAPGVQEPVGWQRYGSPVTPRPIPIDDSGAPPLWAPWYGAGPADAFSRFFRKYVWHQGRASRSEFWWWFLANAVVAAVLAALSIVLETTTGHRVVGTNDLGDPVSRIENDTIWPLIPVWTWSLWSVLTAYGNVMLMIRRLHDANLSGFFAFFFLNVVGWLVLWAMAISPSNALGQRFDPPAASGPPSA